MKKFTLMSVNKQFFLMMLAIMLASCDDSYRIKSESGKIEVTFSDSLLTIYYLGKPVQVVEHELGLARSCNNSPQIIQGDTYELISGKRLKNTERYRECKWEYENGTEMQLRVFDDGVAFRLLDGDTRLAYRVPDGTKRWMQQECGSYEGLFPMSTSSQEGKVFYPALLEYADGIFGLITESGVRHGNSCSYLTCQGNAYAITYTDGKDGCTLSSEGEEDAGRVAHPWRVLIIGSLADVVESNLVTSLAEECRIEDTSWIQPGVSSWIYWAYNHSSKDFQKVREYIDLAADMGWPYTLIDWEWDEMANGGDIDDAMAYAHDKGVKVNLWYNSGTSWIGPGAPGPQDRLRTKEAREREMAHLEEMGVSGIKVDFFREDGCEMVDYYLDILEDAARHHLLVDFHGCTIPRGWNRTWPNLMSMEAVYGAEWYNNTDRMTNAAAAHNATLPFCRNVIGPMDYTPCAFTDSQHPHITTDCHELALPVLFESGLQHMADRPSSFLGLPERVKTLLSGLPAAWDETLLLAGYPGQSAVLARRSGKSWYVAGINGTDSIMTIEPAFKRMGLTGKEDIILVSDNGELPGMGFNIQNPPELPARLTMPARGGFVAEILSSDQ